MRTWKDVATLVKTKNLNGRFVARTAADLPLLLEEGMEVALVPPQTDLPRSGVVDYVCELADGSFEIGFDSVKDETSAHGLVGSHCLVRRSCIQDQLDAEVSASWSGWRVVDVSGHAVGEVVEIIDNPGQSLLVVNRGAELPEAFIPLVDAFIVSVDENEREIVVDVPDGLLTLNDGA